MPVYETCAVEGAAADQRENIRPCAAVRLSPVFSVAAVLGGCATQSTQQPTLRRLFEKNI